MSVPKTRLAALAAAAAATLVATAPAAGRSTLVDDEAPILHRAVAAGLRTSDDNLWQVRGTEAVLGKAREVESIPASSLAGRGSTGIAAVLRKAVVGDAGGHYAIIDDLGAGFGSADGDALAAALARLDTEAAPGGGTIARRVHLYLAPAAGGLLTDPASAGLRTAAFARSGGVWLKTGGWSAAKWLTWPAESARQAAARGLGRARVHVALGAGDQGALWTSARSGSACGVLTNGPGAYRVGGGIEAFAAQYRRTFLRPASAKDNAAGCTAAPALPAAGASALVAAAARETTALPIPPGGLVTPPLVAGEPAQVTLQLGDDPLGLAAGLGVTPEAAWKGLGAIVQVRGPGFAIDAPIAGDGSAPLEFTPTAPGPVTMRLVIRGAGVSTTLGGPADMVAPLAATAGGAGLLSRVVADPDGWALAIPLAPTNGAPGDPVLVIVPPFG